MKLAEWLKSKGVTQTEFAERIGVTSGYISQLCAEIVWPGRKVATEIARATDNAVTANDFVSANASSPSPEAAA